MLKFFDPVRGVEFLDVLVKMITAFVLGGLIGVERSYKNRPAGFRTHILVTLGSAIASMTGIFLVLKAGLPADVSRIGAAVVSGLGFLGAGTIIVTKNNSVKGLTTAAGLWTSGVMGLAVGAGFYEGAVITTALILIAETSLGGLASKIRHDPEFRIEVKFRHKPALDQVLRECKNEKMYITNLRVVSGFFKDEPCYRAFISLRPRTKVDRERLFGKISAVDRILALEEVEMK